MQKRLWILTPAYDGRVFLNYHESVMNLAMELRDAGVPLHRRVVGGFALIPLVRNLLVDMFLQGNGTHALLIDADIGFDPSEVRKMLDLDLDIVGAAYLQKSLNWGKIQGLCKNSQRRLTAQEIVAVTGTYESDPPLDQLGDIKLNQPKEVKALGTGLLMIKRQVFERLIEADPKHWFELDRRVDHPIYDFFRSGPTEEGKYLTEDFAFCRSCRALGFKVWMLPSCSTTHIGPQEFFGNLPAFAGL